MPKDQITITINDKTHQFKADDVDAMRDLPWSERKQLIDLLENIKQAEYIKPSEQPQPSVDARFNSTLNTESQSAPENVATKPSPQVLHSTHSPAPQLDPEIKASEKDVDDLMNRLILEQQKHNKTIPDKSSVFKFFLIVLAIIIALALIF